MHKHIRILEIEATNTCNASCPQCLRTNTNGTAPSDYNDVLDFERVVASTGTDFWAGLEQIHFNGNTGDNIAHPAIKDIVVKTLDLSPNARITISTNGSLRNIDWWASFGSAVANRRVSVIFGIDGLEDTHHLHRVGTSWQKIINNAQAFINAGGHAQWQMIPFQHNQHQIQQCKELAKQLGFKKFFLRHENRFSNKESSQPVYFHNKLTHSIEPPVDIDSLLDTYNHQHLKLSASMEGMSTKKKINCRSIRTNWMAIYADGTVWPCCHLMGWHKSQHQNKFYPLIQYHFDKILKLDLDQMNLYNNTLADIFNTVAWQQGYEQTFENRPNPVCLQQCSV